MPKVFIKSVVYSNGRATVKVSVSLEYGTVERDVNTDPRQRKKNGRKMGSYKRPARQRVNFTPLEFADLLELAKRELLRCEDWPTDRNRRKKCAQYVGTNDRYELYFVPV